MNTPLTSETPSTTFEEDFENLNEGQILIASNEDGVIFSLVFNESDYADGDIVVDTIPLKKSKKNFSEVKDAVKYAKDIMEKGGSIKAWISGDYIHVVQIDC